MFHKSKFLVRPKLLQTPPLQLPEGHRIVLILDSLDQLSSLHGAHGLNWLPKTLPVNVKLIVSTLPKEHNILKTLEASQIPQQQYVEVQALTTKDSMAILQLWLAQQNRQISEPQQKAVSKVVK